MFIQLGKYLLTDIESRVALLLGSRICLVCESEIVPPPLSFDFKTWPRQSKFLCLACLQILEPKEAICCTIGEESPIDCVSVYPYQGTARDTIRGLKYSGKVSLASELARPLLPSLQILLQGNKKDFLIISVPLHPQKLKERGFNQSELIARELANLASLRHDSKALMRTRVTEPQYGLSKIKRRANVQDAFSASNRLKNKTIILIDDVLTSGATALACRDALMAAGAEKVAVLTVARAVLRAENEGRAVPELSGTNSNDNV